MKFLLRNPTRELEIDGPLQVSVPRRRLRLNRDAHLVIADGDLIPADKMLANDAEVEIRSVISGG